MTITDALGPAPAGVRDHHAARLLAAGAGMDLILCSVAHVSEGEQARDGLESGYLDGTLSKSAFRASLQRIIALRSSLGG